MRADLATAVRQALATVDSNHIVVLTAAEGAWLDAAANIVTLARTRVDCDYRGDVIDAHAPEMPTRFSGMGIGSTS